MMVEYHWNGILWTHPRERVFRAWSCDMYSPSPLQGRALCHHLFLNLLCLQLTLLRSVAFPWVVVLFLSAVNLAFIPNLLNRNTEEILWWRNGWVNVGKCVLSSQSLTGYQWPISTYFQCDCIWFVVYILFAIEVRQLTHSDMVMILLWQQQRTDHKQCPLEGGGSEGGLRSLGWMGMGCTGKPGTKFCCGSLGTALLTVRM